MQIRTKSFQGRSEPAHTFRPISSATSNDLSLSAAAWTFLIVVGVGFLAVYFFSYPRAFDSPPAFTSPKDNVDYVLAQEWRSAFSYSLPHQEQLTRPTNLALTPRDASFLDGRVIPKEFAGTMILFGVLHAVAAPLVLLAIPVLAVATAGMVGLITYETFGRRAAVIAYLFWLTFPPFWLTGSKIVSADVPALFFFLTGVYCCLRYMQQREEKWLICAGIAIAASVSFRYPNALILLPIILAAPVLLRLQWRVIVKAVMAAMPVAAGMAVFNQIVNGSPTATGEQHFGPLVAETVNVSSAGVISGLMAAGFATVFVVYFTSPMVMLPLYGGVVALFLMRKRMTEPRVAALASYAATVTVILLLFYGGRTTWGHESFTLNASVLRYVLPAMALWVPFCAGYLTKLVAGQTLIPTTLSIGLGIVLVGNTVFALNSPGGVLAQAESGRFTALVREEVLDVTEPDALVVTRLQDKALFPYRQTVTATFLVQNSEQVPRERPMFQYVPNVEELASRLTELKSLGVPVYLLNDGIVAPEEMPVLEALIAKEEYDLETIIERRSWSLQRVTDG